MVNVIVRRMTKSATVTSNGAGVINSIFTLDPNTGGYSDWAAVGGIYDEYRVLGVEAKFFCAQQNSLTVLSVPVVVVYDNDDASTALTSYGSALDYSVKQQFASVWDNQRFPTLRAIAYSRADASAGVGWITTASTTGTSLKLYAYACSLSTLYLQVDIQLVVQFRGQT